MNKLWKALLGSVNILRFLSSSPAQQPVQKQIDDFPPTDFMDTLQEHRPKASGPQRSFVHYVGHFNDLNIEVNGKAVAAEHIKHYKKGNVHNGIKQTCEKITVEADDTTYVFWNNPSALQKKILTEKNINPAFNLGDMRAQTFGITAVHDREADTCTKTNKNEIKPMPVFKEAALHPDIDTHNPPPEKTASKLPIVQWYTGLHYSQ